MRVLLGDHIDVTAVRPVAEKRCPRACRIVSDPDRSRGALRHRAGHNLRVIGLYYASSYCAYSEHRIKSQISHFDLGPGGHSHDGT